ncbi:hypothetical protein [Nocardia arizonensis]|uniref:hypothetical protein n=1 Tax=Nocardia arizonensis TaxID=1141647 RepID=UPI0006D26139|nr:hypothetical protein [Nocardia arizonensis]
MLTTSVMVAADAAQDFARFGWTVAATAEGLSLITDEHVAGVELTGDLAVGVRRFLRANDLSGPVIEVPGPHRREIHLVTGSSRAEMAIAALRAAGAIVHTGGARIPLPPEFVSVGDRAWGIAPGEARWVPPVVALGAAVRSAARRARLLGAAR